MISSLDPASLSFLNGLDRIQRRTDRAQRELTTGLRINVASDDPSQIADLLATRARLDRITQINSNVDQVKSEVDTSETALQSAVKLVEHAQSLATQGESAFTDANSRNDIATELGGVLQQLVAISNTTVQGRYVFSGDSDQKGPYSLDLTKNNPISTYAGSGTTRQVEFPDGSLVAVAKTAQDIFDSSNPQQNVFQAVNDLRLALLNNDQTGVGAALSKLGGAGTYLNGKLAFYGTVQNSIANARESGSSSVLQLQSQLSGIQDADLTKAIIEFQQATNNQQAALQSRAKLPHTSLFDFLA